MWHPHLEAALLLWKLSVKCSRWNNRWPFYFKDFLSCLCLHVFVSATFSPPTRCKINVHISHILISCSKKRPFLFQHPLFSNFLHSRAIYLRFRAAAVAKLGAGSSLRCHAIWMNQTQSTEQSLDGGMPHLRDTWINNQQRAEKVTRGAAQWKTESERKKKKFSRYRFLVTWGIQCMMGIRSRVCALLQA